MTAPATRKRTTPARTLRVRIDDLGPYHLDAFDRLRKKGGDAYEREVRDALDASDDLARTKARQDQLRAMLDDAERAHANATIEHAGYRLTLDRLTASAKALAAIDVEPDAPTDADRRGVEMPVTRDTAGNVIPHIDF